MDMGTDPDRAFNRLRLTAANFNWSGDTIRAARDGVLLAMGKRKGTAPRSKRARR